MLTRKPHAAAIAALALACAGAAAADERHKGEIEILSLSWPFSQVPATAGELALPNPSPANPASGGHLKFDGIDGKPAIAINTPLRTLPNRSPVVDGSSRTLMVGEKAARPVSAGAAPTAGELAAFPATEQDAATFALVASRFKNAGGNYNNNAASELSPEERAAYVGGNRSTTVGANRSETVKVVPLTPLDDPRLAKDLSAGNPPPSAAWYARFEGVDGSSKNNPPVVRPLRSVPAGEQHLEIKMEDVIVHTFNPGGATPVKHGGPRSLSAGDGRATPALDSLIKFRDLPGESKDARAVHPAAPALQRPAPVVPQRSSVVDGTSNTLMIGEKTVRPALVPAAPAGRR